MAKKIVYHCKRCKYATRADSRRQALIRIRAHAYKKHKNAIVSKLNTSLRRNRENPTLQDLSSALAKGPRVAIELYKRVTEGQYQHMKKVMDALEPVLPKEVRSSWLVLEAIHDGLGKKKRG